MGPENPAIETLVRPAGPTSHAGAATGQSIDETRARRTAEEFEALFLTHMLAPMFENLESDSLFGGGPGAGIYRSMMVREYGKAMARAGGLGIADAVQREILKLQERRP